MTQTVKDNFLSRIIDKDIIGLSIYEMNNKRGVYDNKSKLKAIDSFSTQDVEEIVGKLTKKYLEGNFWEDLYQITEKHLAAKGFVFRKADKYDTN